MMCLRASHRPIVAFDRSWTSQRKGCFDGTRSRTAAICFVAVRQATFAYQAVGRDGLHGAPELRAAEGARVLYRDESRPLGILIFLDRSCLSVHHP